MRTFTLIFKWLAAAFPAAVCALLTGCATVGTPRDLVRGPGYQPRNVFVASTPLPQNIRRVVVLPVACEQNNFDLAEGRAALEPVWRSELIKAKRFEVVPADATFLQNRTGRSEWSDEEPLPPELFMLLRENSGCDAVMFCRLTVYRPYPPLSIGWRARLVDAQTRRTIWSADEIFDGGQPAVGNGARRNQLAEQRDSDSAPDEWFIHNSPSEFGKYAVSRLLATLPPR